MNIVVWILVILICLLVAYCLLLQRQLHNMNQQLSKRLDKNTRQPVALELMNKELIQLTININKCLKAEENLRLESVREEKQFKELITSISHDLRTPLTAIRGYQQLIDQGELSEEQRKKLQIAMKHSEELGRLIDHFYEYTYLVNVEPKFQLERVNLTNLLAECLVESVPSLEQNNLSLQYEEAPPVFIQGNREMIIRILQNLLRNGIQHSAGQIHVTLVAKDNAILSFQNPIKENVKIDIDKLFERFYVGDVARSNSTGLGLSIVKLLTEQMGGNVGASINGEVLTIQVQLPLYVEV